MIVPNMGKRVTPTEEALVLTGVARALFTPVQQRVLGLLFGQPERRYQGNELIRLAGSGTGAVHRLVTRLAAAGMVTVERVGNQKHYRANADSPIYAELRGLVAKTVRQPAKRLGRSKR
jgi:predicted transcriptional regulator